MAANYKPQTTVNWTSDQAYSQFRLWRKEVERIINGPMHDEEDQVQLNTVFIWAGAHAETLVEARQAEEPTLKVETVPNLLDCLQKCLTHSTLYREAREDFYNLKQRPDENTTTYYSRINELYKMADFPANSDFLIVDKLIHGCNNATCKRKMMAKGKDVTLKICLDLLRANEAIDVTMKRMGESTATSNINAMYRSKDPTKQSQQKGSKHNHRRTHPAMPLYQTYRQDRNNCTWCGGSKHPRDKCPAKDSKCNFCHKKGHFQKACILQSKLKQNVIEKCDNSDNSDNDDQQSTYDMYGCTTKPEKREVLANVTFETPHPVTLQGKVDTGAMVSCMPATMLKLIGLTKADLTPNKARLRGVTGTEMNTAGELTVTVSCNNINKTVKIIITELGSELILGLNFCKLFQLVKISDICIQRKVEVIDAVKITDEEDVDYAPLQQKWKQHLPLGKKTGNAFEDLKLIFPDTFDGNVGLFKGEVDLKLAPDAKPVQLPPRSVPLSVLPKLKGELDKMERDGIIRPCPETTEWVHNLVIASKKDGNLRICLDPKNLNKHLIRKLHYTASWEDAKHSFSNGKYFSTLDAKSGYWTKKLSKESELLTAFNTPFKKYCFCRLPFGISAASEIFCEEIDTTFDGIPGTFPCADDVKVQGSTEEKHDINLLETVAKAQSAGLKFNPKKCHIKQIKIEYFGRIVSSGGVDPCPKKVKAIVELPPPKNKQELQSFLGTVNFMATFIPNLAKMTHLMRHLIKKDTHFIWTKDMQKELENVKSAIANTTQLTHFNPNGDAIIETDASLKGLGAVLIQNGRPVRFLSKSLTSTEADYSNIERELLAVLFACEKLHTYAYGRKTVIHTDHKPLESIFAKPISLAPARLQRMLLRLRIYDLDVKYVGANKVLIADTLSRLVVPNKDKAVPDLDVTIAQVLKIRPTLLQSLQGETKTDSSLKELSHYINNGWPNKMHELPVALQPYWCFRDELAILDGIVMKGNRVIVPQTLIPETLVRLHDGHQGLSATLQRARRTVFWPKLQQDINNLLLKCTSCQVHAKKKARPSEKQVSTTRPMEMLGVDLMHHQGEDFLVTIDYFSGYTFTDKISSQTAESVIKTLNHNFRKLGLAEKMITDNGPCFKSEKFTKYFAEIGVEHITSSPHYHQSNGRVERAIQNIKQLMKKCKAPTDMTLALIAYHDTPICEGVPSPAELFFNRRINTRLGMMQPIQLTDSQKIKLMDKRTAHLHPPTDKECYIQGQSIWFTEDGCSEWKAGYIETPDTAPDSYWIVNASNDRRLRRNVHDLKPRLAVMADQAPPIKNMHRNHLAIQHTPNPTRVQHRTQTQLPDEHSNQAQPDTPSIEPDTPSIEPDTTMEENVSHKPIPRTDTPIKIAQPRLTEQPIIKNLPTTTRSGRQIKPNRNDEYIYQCHNCNERAGTENLAPTVRQVLEPLSPK